MCKIFWLVRHKPMSTGSRSSWYFVARYPLCTLCFWQKEFLSPEHTIRTEKLYDANFATVMKSFGNFQAWSLKVPDSFHPLYGTGVIPLHDPAERYCCSQYVKHDNRIHQNGFGTRSNYEFSNFDSWCKASLSSSLLRQRARLICRRTPELEPDADQIFQIMKPVFGLVDSGDRWGFGVESNFLHIMLKICWELEMPTFDYMRRKPIRNLILSLYYLVMAHILLYLLGYGFPKQRQDIPLICMTTLKRHNLMRRKNCSFHHSGVIPLCPEMSHVTEEFFALAPLRC